MCICALQKLSPEKWRSHKNSQIVFFNNVGSEELMENNNVISGLSSAPNFNRLFVRIFQFSEVSSYLFQNVIMWFFFLSDLNSWNISYKWTNPTVQSWKYFQQTLKKTNLTTLLEHCDLTNIICYRPQMILFIAVRFPWVGNISIATCCYTKNER